MSYHVTCSRCGHAIASSHPFGKCSCGQVWRVEWPADIPKTSDATLRTMTEGIEAQK